MTLNEKEGQATWRRVAYLMLTISNHHLHSACVSPTPTTSPAASAPDPQTAFCTEEPEAATKSRVVSIISGSGRKPKTTNAPLPVTSAPAAPASAVPPGKRRAFACKPLAPRPAACVDPRSAEPGCATRANQGPRLPSRNARPAPASRSVQRKRIRGRWLILHAPT